eukprot:2677677-Rhodomonas_salina.1
MARTCLPFVLMPHDPNKTFCSKYVTDALQYAGVQGVRVPTHTAHTAHTPPHTLTTRHNAP